MTAVAATTQPSPLWFATRGAGTVSLLLLTLVVCLGVVTTTGWRSRLWPRFLTQTLHRNASLLALVFIALHVATSVLDPFAHLRWRDALVPWGSAYRPVFVGLGAVALQMLLALTLTSMVRTRIGPRPWRALHWLAYAAWPVAVVHGLGTGSDTRAAWSVGTTTACVGAVLTAVGWRLSEGWPRRSVLRGALGGVSVSAAIMLAAWTAAGPMQPDWGRRAQGLAAATPRAAAAAQQVHLDLVGTVQHDPSGASRMVLSGGSPPLAVVVRPPAAGEAQPVLVVSRGARQVCSTPASVTTTVDAVCAGTRVRIDLSGDPTALRGSLVAWGVLP